MESLGYRLLAFLCGAVLGSFNWYLMYKLYRLVAVLSGMDKTSTYQKSKLVLGFFFKLAVLFGGCYLVLAVFGMSALWFVAGISLSLAGTVFVLYKRSL